MDTPDPVLVQLKKLREGAGLTRERLPRMGAVMSALGASDPSEAYDSLVALIDGLGDGERARALAVDYGLNLAVHFGRPASGREVDWLGERRHGFGEVIGRDAKTLARWSDRTVSDLRARLLSDFFAGDLFVTAVVEGGRALGCTLIRRQPEDDNAAESTTVDFKNPSAEPSPPFLVYAFPRDWRPRTLTLVVAFKDGQLPDEVTAVVADGFLSLSFAEARYPLALNDGIATCKIVKPRRDRVYGVWWSQPGTISDSNDPQRQV